MLNPILLILRHLKSTDFYFLGFGILVALFPFHTWAARGYDSAPTSVSMLHAGVLKKFGLYGLIQIALPLLPDAALSWSPWLMWLALGNILFVGMVAIAQTNFKSMVSYGSVMHMGYCFLGIGACSALGAWLRCHAHVCSRTVSCFDVPLGKLRKKTHEYF